MKPKDEKLPLWLTAVVLSFVTAFLTCHFAGVMYPEHWFVKTFLAGERIWIAALVLIVVMGWIVAIKDGAGGNVGYQRRSKRSDFK